MTEIVSADEPGGHLAAFLDRAEEGEDVIVTSGDRRLAHLGPPNTTSRRRRGLLKGQIWMAPDFDETPAEVIAAMVGDDR